MTLGQIALWGLAVGFVMSMVVITGFAYTTLLERKVLARMQSSVMGRTVLDICRCPERQERTETIVWLYAARSRRRQTLLQRRFGSRNGRSLGL